MSKVTLRILNEQTQEWDPVPEEDINLGFDSAGNPETVQIKEGSESDRKIKESKTRTTVSVSIPCKVSL